MAGMSQGDCRRGGNAATAAGYDYDIAAADRIPGRDWRCLKINQSQSGSPLGRQAGLNRTAGQQLVCQGCGGGSLIGKVPQIDRPAGNLRPLIGCRLHQSGQSAGERISQRGTFEAAEAAVKP